MDVAQSHASSRLVRALVAGGLLAAAWFVTDSVLSAQPVAAADRLEIVPSADSPVADLLDTVSAALPVVAPVIAPVTTAVHPVVDVVDAAVAPISPITAPILSPVREATQPVVDTVVSPVLEGTIDVLAPVIAPVVVGVTPIVETVAATVPTTLDVVPGLLDTSVVSSRMLIGAALSGDGGAAMQVALLGALVIGAASAVPGGLLYPIGRSPLVPDSGSSFAPGFVAEILAWRLAPIGSSGPPSGALVRPHASPVFASDTTPD